MGNGRPLEGGDMEGGDVLAQWHAVPGGADLAIDPEIHHGGVQSLRVRAMEGARGPTVAKHLLPAAELAGKRLIVSAYVRREHDSGPSPLWLRASNGRAVTMGIGAPERRAVHEGTWERMTATIDVPFGADEVVVGTFVADGKTVWIDDLEFETAPGTASVLRGHLLPVLLLLGASSAVLVLAHGRISVRRPLRLLAGAMAVVGPSIALAAPGDWFARFRELVIGTSDDRSPTTAAQRVAAVLGAWLGALVVYRLAEAEERQVALPPTRWIVLGAVPLALMALFNVARGLSQLGIDNPLAIHLPGAITMAVLVVSAAPAVVAHVRRTPLSSTRSALMHGAVAGAAYGFFSGLWHCCPPLWTRRAPAMLAFEAASHVLWPVFVLGFGALLAVRASRWSLVVGGLALALVYGWHTPIWALHCFAGGVFCTFLAQRTGSALTGGAFLVAAYVVHMSAPFIGWLGAAAALVAFAASARVWLHPRPRTAHGI